MIERLSVEVELMSCSVLRVLVSLTDFVAYEYAYGIQDWSSAYSQI